MAQNHGNHALESMEEKGNKNAFGSSQSFLRPPGTLIVKDD